MDLIAIPLGIALAVALVTLLGRLVLSRRGERAAAIGPARLVRHELETIIRVIEDALESGRWWQSKLDVPTWENEKTKLASVMTEDEVMTFHHATVWIGSADAMARKGRGFGRPRSRPMTAEDREYVQIVLQVVRIAEQSILPLARGKGGLIRSRRTPFAISPDPSFPCQCGHRWHEHAWAARRRWIRFPHIRASHMDVAAGCENCACGRFRARDRAWLLKRLLRRLRMVPQTRLPKPDELEAVPVAGTPN